MKIPELLISTTSPLDSIIDLHERMRGAYFFLPPANSYARRVYENKNSMTSEVKTTSGHYVVRQDTECSCRKVYYRMTINLLIDGQEVRTNKTIRYIKVLMSH